MMRWLVRGAVAGMAGLAASLGLAPTALANGGHLHLGGSVGVPAWVAWLVAGIGVAFVGFFVFMWVRVSLARRRSPADGEPNPGQDQDTDLVYPDAWQRHVIQIEDPDVREVALGGPDTATRLPKDKESHEPQPRS